MLKNIMFSLNMQHDVTNYFKTCSKNASYLWHLQFWHFNFGGLELLSKTNMVKDLPCINNSNQLCEWCLLGKQFRKIFPKESKLRAKRLLDLIYIDICAPINLNFFDKNNFFFLFIDDFLRKTYLYFLKQKLEVFETFKTFKVAVEKESGYQIKAMRFDRGGEFSSKEFQNFCEAKEFDTLWQL